MGDNVEVPVWLSITVPIGAAVIGALTATVMNLWLQYRTRAACLWYARITAIHPPSDYVVKVENVGDGVGFAVRFSGVGITIPRQTVPFLPIAVPGDGGYSRSFWGNGDTVSESITFTADTTLDRAALIVSWTSAPAFRQRRYAQVFPLGALILDEESGPYTPMPRAVRINGWWFALKRRLGHSTTDPESGYGQLPWSP